MLGITNISKWFSRLTVVLALVVVGGCYPDWPEHTGTAEIHGTVTLDGLPVNKANVVFLPVKLRTVGDKIMPLAYGITDAEGGFQLEYSDGRRELMAGTYTVMISKVAHSEDDEGRTVEPWRTALLPDTVSALAAFSEQGETIPSIYNRNSSLLYEVEASPSIARPRFELSSIDRTLEDLPVVDLPLK